MLVAVCALHQIDKESVGLLRCWRVGSLSQHPVLGVRCPSCGEDSALKTEKCVGSCRQVSHTLAHVQEWNDDLGMWWSAQYNTYSPCLNMDRNYRHNKSLLCCRRKSYVIKDFDIKINMSVKIFSHYSCRKLCLFISINTLPFIMVIMTVSGLCLWRLI